MKKVMLLGGNYFQMTATKAAKELGYYVVSVDYLPNNPAHRFADEYYNVSTTDKEKVLELARRLQIDGIVSYASDVSAPTAAYVATELGLPTNPLESVEILTNKKKFREFLRNNGFKVPVGECFTEYKEAAEYFSRMPHPMVVKPTDASGSKGVHKVFTMDEFRAAWDDALIYSRNQNIFVEQFIEKCGYEIDADSFLVDGDFAYFGVMDQHNDLNCNPYVPVGLSGPSVLPHERKNIAKSELIRLMNLLNMRMGAFNIEYIFDKNDDLYILEVGPRNGGNLISDAIQYGTGVDLAKYTILAAVGDSCKDLKDKSYHSCVSSYVVHSMEDGIYEDIWISDKIKNDIVRFDMFIKKGEKVRKFNNASFGIGAMLIKFDSVEQMTYRMDHMEEFIRVIVKK
jgi:biotin carboxylase